jgi:hypothetical protein
MIPFALLAVALPWGIWGVYELMLGGGSQSTAFNAATGWFVILAICYLGLHGLRNMAWTSVPVLMTFQALVGFVGIPVWRFVAGDDQVDSGYVHAMILVLVGFGAFWIGSLVVKREVAFRFVPRAEYTPDRVAFMSVAMLGLGLAGDLVEWRLGLFSYISDAGAREASRGAVQWLSFVANLLTVALVVSAIEVFGRRSKALLIRSVFWLSLFFLIGFGVISGMKGEIVQPLVYVVVIYTITNRRMPRTAFLLPVFVVVLVYPFVTAYRENLNGGYRAQVNSRGGLEATLVKSFSDAFLSFGSTSQEAESAHSKEATSRLSYLTFVRSVVDLPAPSMLQGDEKVWMAPFYPLVPRFLWKEKPVLDKGIRLAFLLGSRGGTSAALTPIGDLYSMYGTYGVATGMLMWGACLQLFTNWISLRNISERGLFFYISVLPMLLYIEGDVVGLIAGTVQAGIATLLMSYVIYGSPAARLRTANLRIG